MGDASKGLGSISAPGRNSDSTTLRNDLGPLKVSCINSPNIDVGGWKHISRLISRIVYIDFVCARIERGNDTPGPVLPCPLTTSIQNGFGVECDRFLVQWGS